MTEYTQYVDPKYAEQIHGGEHCRTRICRPRPAAQGPRFRDSAEPKQSGRRRQRSSESAEQLRNALRRRSTRRAAGRSSAGLSHTESRDEYMAEITAALVKQLRERTGAGMMECKKALVEAKGDLAEAEVVLRKRGIASAGKKASRATKQGLIGTYIHPGGQLGVMVEVNCESDFVARTDDFQELVHDIAMQIAAADPQFIRKEESRRTCSRKRRRSPATARSPKASPRRCSTRSSKAA